MAAFERRGRPPSRYRTGEAGEALRLLAQMRVALPPRTRPR